MSTPEQAQIERFLRRWRDSGRGTTWVVAVSGGSDSVALVRLLRQVGEALGFRFSVAHLNHGVRQEAARHDAEFVAALAESLGLAFDLGHWQPTGSAGFEAEARRARYEWLGEVAQARGASAVAVGHTRDDQAETILHRLVRGTGLRGLAGMPACRRLTASATLVRPLLRLSREQLRAYLATVGQGYCEDATNLDQKRTRSRIRHDLLPRLVEQYNPRAVDALVRLGQLADGAEQALHRQVSGLVRSALLEHDRVAGRVVLNRHVVASGPPFLRAEVFRAVWRRLGWPEREMTATRWRRLARLASRSSGRVSLGAGVDVVNDSATMVLVHCLPAPPVAAVGETPVTLPVPGSVPWGAGEIIAVFERSPSSDETIDFDQVVGALVVREPRAGDRFEPLGMQGRSTPLTDFLRGRSVDRADRRSVPLVCDDRGIVWVAGHRIAERVRRTSQTVRTLSLAWNPNLARPASAPSEAQTLLSHRRLPKDGSSCQ